MQITTKNRLSWGGGGRVRGGGVVEVMWYCMWEGDRYQHVPV